MVDENLRTMLAQFGFSGPEARVYIALSGRAGMTGYELARKADMARANAYAAVASLVTRGAIQQVAEQPAKYALGDPESYFTELTRKTDATSRALIAAMRERQPSGENGFVTQVKGPVAVQSTITDLIDNATVFIHLKTMDTLAAPFFDAIRKRALSGIDVTIVASGDGWEPLEGVENITIIPHEGTGSAPSAPHGVLLTITADAERMVTASFSDPVRAYVTSEGTVVYVMQTMIQHEIYLAEIYRVLGPDVLERNGLSFSDLRAKFRPLMLGRKVFE
jgi:sugar-specific transcriptional regulator TrmB